MVAALERPFGIGEDVGDILCVAHLAVAFADLQERIVGRAGEIGRIEQEHGTEPLAPAGSQLEILALDVVDDRGMRPCQEGWDDKTDALPGPRRRKTQHMFGTIVPEIVAIKTTKHDPVRAKESSAPSHTSRRVGLPWHARPIG